MRVKDLRDIRDLKDLKDVDRKDVVELLGSGRKNARRAIGAPGEGAVPAALIGGIVVGAIVGALLALVFSPFGSGEARQRLTKEVARIRERVPVKSKGVGDHNGGSLYPPEDAPETMRSPRTGVSEGTPTA